MLAKLFSHAAPSHFSLLLFDLFCHPIPPFYHKTLKAIKYSVPSGTISVALREHSVGSVAPAWVPGIRMGLKVCLRCLGRWETWWVVVC